MQSKLSKEIKDHKETKEALKSLEKEYIGCQREISQSQEEKERLKIEVTDLKAIMGLSKDAENVIEDIQIQDKICSCKECDYPFKTENCMNQHIKKHQIEVQTAELKSNCNICSVEVTSMEELRKHIGIKHSKQFNCQDCDFQASSQIILNKHNNLSHKTNHE